MRLNTTLWIVGAVGMICVMQLTPTDATPWHAAQVRQYFKRIKLDKTKNQVYLHDVKRGIRTQLRVPLLQKALLMCQETQLSSDCLNRMVDKARQHENKFYAKFTYACKGHPEYSAVCLETARPQYYRNLRKLAKETIKCWTLK
uniref:Aegyptin/gSG7 salivary protein-like four-helix bundle domain-containing protein n=1 Tax=Anopheles dirus TaxID=7168 RepID=A0A182NFE0_9DIPT